MALTLQNIILPEKQDLDEWVCVELSAFNQDDMDTYEKDEIKTALKVIIEKYIRINLEANGDAQR